MNNPQIEKPEKLTLKSLDAKLTDWVESVKTLSDDLEGLTASHTELEQNTANRLTALRTDLEAVNADLLRKQQADRSEIAYLKNSLSIAHGDIKELQSNLTCARVCCWLYAIGFFLCFIAFLAKGV